MREMNNQPKLYNFPQMQSQGQMLPQLMKKMSRLV